MKWLKNKHFYLLIGFVLILFYPLFFSKIPIASDALVGLYHPWRDFFAREFPSGIPFKNSLITDPFRQQYPYRELAISLLKNRQLPLWNPYSFGGTPLLANIQTAVLYPFNILFFVFSFATAWSILVLLQPLLAGVFTYLYLKSLKIDSRAALMGALAFAFSGFMIAWQQWNTIGHVALWLPLILLAKDKLLEKFSLRWVVVLIFAESSMIFAGHLQTAFYLVIFTTMHLLFKAWYSTKQLKKFLVKLLPFCITVFFVLLTTSIQLIPTLQFISHSARNLDLPDWQRNDWFIPWPQLFQFFAPDFFGNPATGNYWGIWNYGEFIGYIGFIPLVFALFSSVFNKRKESFFYTVAVVICLLFALPTPIGKLPYQFNIPFISTLQPSRIIVLIDFSLAVLAGLGFDYILKAKKFGLKKVILFFGIFIILFKAVWFQMLFGKQLGFDQELLTYFIIAKRNLILPSIFLFVVVVLFIVYVKKDQKAKLKSVIILVFFLVTLFDLFRFVHKFTPFTDKSLLFSGTNVIEFLQKNLGNFRFMTTDRRIMPPNVSTIYRLQDVSGYDPLYLKNYGELVAAWTRDKPDITPGSFNRILTPEDFNSFFADLLGVKYVLSLKDEDNPKLQLVFQEGETRVYENINVLPRVFLVESILSVANKKEAIEQVFTNAKNLNRVAIVENPSFANNMSAPLGADEYAHIQSYTENTVRIETSTNQNRFLVLSDIYYPSWNAYIDGEKTKIFKTDDALRGIIVPRGLHKVSFKITIDN